MKPVDLMVRCMAWPENGQWVAVCVDFALAAQADTVEEARQSLSEQITQYVREAFTVDKQHAEALLRRKGPFYDRLRYRAFKLLSSCVNHGRAVTSAVRRSAKFAYLEPLPVAPA